MRKRETNKQRREREGKRRTILQMAKDIAGAIRVEKERKALSAQERKYFDFDHADKVEGIISGRGDEKTLASLASESIEIIAQSLRLAADMFEEKPMDGRTFAGHDRKIRAAWLEAIQRVQRDHPHRVKLVYADAICRITTAQPSFSEILKVYREQNPGVKVEDRSLRRCLRRLGISTHPDKRGRPTKNRTPKTDLIR
jgi:hypothetical protein